MNTAQRFQTTAALGQGLLRLNGLIPSPYTAELSGIGPFRNTNRFLNMIAIIEQIDTTLSSYRVRLGFNDGGTGVGPTSFLIPFSNVTTFPDDMPALIVAGVIDVCDANSLAHPDSYQYTDAISQLITSLPMMVSGVAKSSTYPVVASPAVAGGSGIARFYIDSNGDGTGTAPSEVYTASLQAVVVNATLGYVPQSFTVDTNRKYIDVKMGSLSFTGLTILGQSVLGAQSIANATNGIVVNCTVFVKK